MRSRRALAASLLVLSVVGAACRAESNQPAARVDELNRRERQLLDKLDVVQQREREIQSKLEDVRRRKQAYLSRVVTRPAHAPEPTPRAQ